MHTNTNDNFDIRQYNDIIEYSHESQDIGICKWNINKNTIYISEKITGYKLGTINSFLEFINIIVFHKDKDLAIQEFYDYINGLTPFYNSTFRISTKDGEIRWILFDGIKLTDETTNDVILHVLMFNVTGYKLREGHDALTNGMNNMMLRKKLIKSIELAKSDNRKGALIYIDINNLKAINNNFGFNCGDIVLKKFSELTNFEMYRTDELAKMPDDKFVILIHNFNNLMELKERCDKIHEVFEKPIRLECAQIYIELSLGVTIFPDHSSNADELLKFSRLAANESKLKGTNECALYSKELSESYNRQLLIEGKLPHAINNNELYLNYQPQIDASNNELVGFEALLRWNNSEIGKISPAEFIPIAENKGYIANIGYWVLEESLKTASKWREKGYKFEFMSVNISWNELRESDFLDNLINLCKRYKIPHSLLEIELTERVLIKSNKRNLRIIEELSESGFKIALDDFGIGYSNLNTILNFHFQTLKIDKSIIDNIENDKRQLVIKSIIDISNHFGYKVTAEGVETKEQLDILAELGCNRIQGYYFSKPLPAEEIEKLLRGYLINSKITRVS